MYCALKAPHDLNINSFHTIDSPTHFVKLTLETMIGNTFLCPYPKIHLTDCCLPLTIVPDPILESVLSLAKDLPRR